MQCRRDHPLELKGVVGEGIGEGVNEGCGPTLRPPTLTLVTAMLNPFDRMRVFFATFLQ